MDPILVVNAGSSSVKFQVFAIEGSSELTLQIKGQIDGIGTQPRLRATRAGGIDAGRPALSNAASSPTCRRRLRDGGRLAAPASYDIMPIAVGHRVVHGGPQYDRPILVDARRCSTNLEQYVPLAPLHQPNNLAPIRIAARALSRTCRRSRVSTPPFIAVTLRSPTTTPCRSIFMRKACVVTASTACRTNTSLIACPKSRRRSRDGRVIVAHLGSGASMCAMANGRSVESTMGFTALDGLPMGTRPGQIDPGVVLYLIDQKRT